jgi:alpha-tubulin suppressor-like RCC1 family protein
VQLRTREQNGWMLSKKGESSAQSRPGVLVAIACAAACSVPPAAEAMIARSRTATARPPLTAQRAKHRSHTRRAVCRAGHLLLALHGPREVQPQQPTAYTFLARPCPGTRMKTLRGVRLSVRGPQRQAWVLRRVSRSAGATRTFAFTFPVPADPRLPVTVTLEARSRRGKLLGRARVRIYYRAQQGAAVTPPPPVRPPGPDTTVGWGANTGGELGAGYRSPPVPNPVAGTLRDVRQVAAAYNAGYALLGDGTVRAWGGNYTGALGDGTVFEKVNPIQVPGLSQVVQIAASGAHALALLANGTVYAWGGNFFGTLGNGTRDTVEGAAHPVPSQVPGLTGVVAIASGGGDNAALLANGTVLAWGENKNGQLGDGTKETKLSPTPVRGLANVQMIALGGISSLGGHLLALLRDGTVMVAGENQHGQLGLGDTSDRLLPVPVPGLSHVTSVSASVTHSLALVAGGAVLSWGAGEDGELGYHAPESCEGTPCEKLPRPVSVPRASAVSAGWRFSELISEEQVLSFGANELGQLGTGSLTPTAVPLRVGGIAGVHAISAGEKFTLAMAEYGLSPHFSVVPLPGGLQAQWAPLAGGEPWALSWRPFTKPRGEWSAPVTLPASTHSYVITGLSPRLYEVRLKRLGSSFGYEIAYGIPG